MGFDDGLMRDEVEGGVKYMFLFFIYFDGWWYYLLVKNCRYVKECRGR